MITSKQDLKEFLEADRIALGRKGKKPAWNDFIWKFEISLRKAEYYHNTKGGYLHRFIGKYHRFNMLVWGGMQLRNHAERF